jgi:hypothetical protein
LAVIFVQCRPLSRLMKTAPKALAVTITFVCPAGPSSSTAIESPGRPVVNRGLIADQPFGPAGKPPVSVW